MRSLKVLTAIAAVAMGLAGCTSVQTVNWGDGTVSKVASVGFPGLVEPSARAVLAKRCPSAESYKLNNADEFGPCREEHVQVVGGPGVVEEVVPGVLGIMAARAGRSSVSVSSNADANAQAQANGGEVKIIGGKHKHGGDSGGGPCTYGQTNGGEGGCGGGGGW